MQEVVGTIKWYPKTENIHFWSRPRIFRISYASVGLFLISLPVDICVTSRTYDADQWDYTVPQKDSERFTSTPPFSGLAVE